MEFYDEADFVEDDHFVEIPCEFCSKLVSIMIITEHQTGCPFNPDNMSMTNEGNLISFEEKCTIKDEIEITLPEKENIQKKEVLLKEKAPSQEKINKQDFPMLETLEDILQENTASFSFGSKPDREKKVEEEKPSFTISSIPLLNSREMRNQIHNELSESDKEEGESLEEFWKKANIKLSQRLRELEKNKPDRKV